LHYELKEKSPCGESKSLLSLLLQLNTYFGSSYEQNAGVFQGRKRKGVTMEILKAKWWLYGIRIIVCI